MTHSAAPIGDLKQFVRSEVARQLAEVEAVRSPVVVLDVPLEVMTTHQAAQYLGVSVRTLYDWRRLHRGPAASRSGRLLRYRKADVDAFLSGRHAVGVLDTIGGVGRSDAPSAI
jgi:excisionase family DNA binding protein